MAYVEWDVTSLSSVRIAAAEKAAGFWYGSLYGVIGHWLKIPNSAPAIGSITLTANPLTSGGGDGMYLSYKDTCNPVAYLTAKTIVSYERGGRWINMHALASSVGTPRMVLGNSQKKIKLY